jgi:hypothetical protein
MADTISSSATYIQDRAKTPHHKKRLQPIRLPRQADQKVLGSHTSSLLFSRGSLKQKQRPLPLLAPIPTTPLVIHTMPAFAKKQVAGIKITPSVCQLALLQHPLVHRLPFSLLTNQPAQQRTAQV